MSTTKMNAVFRDACWTRLTISAEEAFKRGNFAMYFVTKAERDAFVASLPKFVKAKSIDGGCGGPSHLFDNAETFGREGQIYHRIRLDGTYAEYATYGLHFYIMGANGITGEVNEAGEKRRKAFFAAADKQLNIVDALEIK